LVLSYRIIINKEVLHADGNFKFKETGYTYSYSR